MPRWRTIRSAVLAVAVASLACGATATERVAVGAAAEDAAVVYTRGEVRSFFEEAGGKFYVRLKMLPGWKIPFSTQNFLVTDRALVAGIEVGASVRFTAKRLAGENTLTSIQVAEPCKRFRSCD